MIAPTIEKSSKIENEPFNSVDRVMQLRITLHLRAAFCIFSIFSCLEATAQNANDPQDQSRVEFFENQIRPMLVKHCYECHSAESDDVMGGLLVDSREDLIQGGDTGPAIVPNDLEKSLLFKAISYKDRDLQMPPENQLPVSVIADFEKWITDGAEDPRKKTKSLAKPAFNLQKRKTQHWAWQPRKTFDGEMSIDYFIDQSLRKANTTALEPANSNHLVRRIYLDLIGLPPTIDQLNAFLKAEKIDHRAAVRELVNELLESPQFGEKWARHWLDVMRYCETKGHVTDQERPHAWMYRDYVIDALNDDLPYDQFVIEHLAGDLLESEKVRRGRDGQTNISVIATGSLFMHEMHFMAVDPVKQRWDEINAQIDVVGKAFLGLTTECARCHDHKFDAISQKDYYALAGIFWNTEQSTSRTAPRRNLQDQQAATVQKLESDLQKFLSTKVQQRKNAQRPKANGKYFPVSEELGIQSPGDTRNLFGKMNAIQKMDPSWQYWARSAKDVSAKNVSLLIRGEHKSEGEIIPRGFLTAIGAENEATFPESDRNEKSGRKWLGEKIVNPTNPLTARVAVNRIWHHLFGQGIVASPNNFGKLGANPTHPELLDYLANRLIKNEWSLKSMIREIVSSKAYQRSSNASKELVDADPNNKLLARFPRRRMTAEQIRDSMLFVAGSLNAKMYGESVDVFTPPYATANKPSNVPKSGPLDGANRRSIYIKVRKNFYDPFLQTFDFPDRGKSIGKRNVTNVPSQSLAMLNSPLVHEISDDWGRVCSDSNDDQTTIIDKMFLASIGRSPSQSELALAERILRASERAKLSSEQQWKQIAHLLFNHPEFIWIE